MTTDQLVRDAYEAFQTGDMQRMAGYLDERVVWHVPGRGPLAGDKPGTHTFTVNGAGPHNQPVSASITYTVTTTGGGAGGGGGGHGSGKSVHGTSTPAASTFQSAGPKPERTP
jgi:ketosteroid isomerase-like protein